MKQVPFLIIPIAIGGMVVGIGLGLLVYYINGHINGHRFQPKTLPAILTSTNSVGNIALPANMRCCCGEGVNCTHFR